ncbi:MAG: hypothetical protein RO257_14545 [Candidatus Kapabacteria bacterium]|nr:hypothetical protein [Candidatus Kapabacteria bacterium]
MHYTTIKNKQRSEYMLSDPLRYSISDFTIKFGDAELIRIKDGTYFLLDLEEIAEYSESKSKIQQVNLKAPVAVYELAEVGFRLMNYDHVCRSDDIPFLILDSYCHKLGKSLKANRIAFVDRQKFNNKMAKKHFQQNIDTFFKKESPIPRNMKFYSRKMVTMPVVYMPGELEEIKKIQALIAESRSIIAVSNNSSIYNVTETIDKIYNIETSGEISNIDVNIEIQLAESD